MKMKDVLYNAMFIRLSMRCFLLKTHLKLKHFALIFGCAIKKH